METSFFNNATYLQRQKKRLVAVSLVVPGWWRCEGLEIAIELQPTDDLIKTGIRYFDYIQLLRERNITPRDIYDKYSNAVLMCWERTREDSVRDHIARWVEKYVKGVEVREWTNMVKMTGEKVQGEQGRKPVTEPVEQLSLL